MIGATCISSRVQSAASWSKCPPFSCCRWRSPDVPWRRKRIWLPIPHSSLRAMPGMAPAVRTPTSRSELQKARSPHDLQPDRFPLRTASIRIRTRSSDSGWLSARDACVRRKPKTRDWPRPPTELGARSRRASPRGLAQDQRSLIEASPVAANIGARKNRASIVSFSHKCHCDKTGMRLCVLRCSHRL